jgi:hypothetical protein
MQDAAHMEAAVQDVACQQLLQIAEQVGHP